MTGVAEDRELVDLVIIVWRKVRVEKEDRDGRSASPSGSEVDDDIEPGSPISSGRKRTARRPRRDSGRSDADLELEEEQDHLDKNEATVSERDSEPAHHRKEPDVDEVAIAAPSGKSDTEGGDVIATSSGRNVGHVKPVKRKRVITSSDEEDNTEEVDSAENRDEEPAPVSPIISQKKKNRLVIDSDED
ncbi:hypothetical protein COOONC_28444 [Cooperia oncophora]